MREIHLNGYIDEDTWFGDEITPDTVHEKLYPENADPGEDVRIILNSYGGSCNAATQMFDDIKAYPGNVHLIISGTAASAATVLAMAADRLEITPGSLFMIHDPLIGAYGNEADLEAAQDILRACKCSIINVYRTRSHRTSDDIAAMMSATTWMDAEQAVQEGFVDGILDGSFSGILNTAGFHTVSREEAEMRVRNWADRHRAFHPAAKDAAPALTETGEDIRQNNENAEQTPLKHETLLEPESGTPADELNRRLERLKYNY